MPYTIITDSCSNLPESMIDEYGIEVLPLVFLIDGKHCTSYTKGNVTDLKEFYTLLREGKLITTSLPNLGDARATIEERLKQGDDVLYLGFSSALSGTYEAVEGLCKELKQQYPDRKLITVDTLAAALGEGMLVAKAAAMKQAGATIEEVAQWVQDNRLHQAHWFTVDDLMYLFRGGRVSRTSAFAANMLSIKPVLHVDDAGALIPMEKVRGRKKSIKALVDHMEQTGVRPLQGQTVYISHGDCEDDAEALRQLIYERFGVEYFLIRCLDPVIGAHSGPGTLALFFEATQR